MGTGKVTNREKLRKWYLMLSYVLLFLWVIGPTTQFFSVKMMWITLLLYFVSGAVLKVYKFWAIFVVPGILSNFVAIASNHWRMPADIAEISGLQLDNWHSNISNATKFRFLCDIHPVLWHAAICSIGDMMILGGMALVLLCFLYNYFFIRYKSYGV